MRSCADTFFFRIVDKATQKDLVFDSNPIYSSDSVYLMTNLPQYPGHMSYHDSTRFQSNLDMPVDTFYLRLSSADTDTLLMTYNFVKNYCCKPSGKYGKIAGIKYNGVAARKAGDTYVFEK